MVVPWGSLVAQRSRVLPQGGAILGRLSEGLRAGYQEGQQRAAENAAPDVFLNGLDALYGHPQPTAGTPATLGNLAPTATTAAPSIPNIPQPGEPGFSLRRPADGTPTPAQPTIRYDYGAGTIRNEPISADLQRVLNQAAQAAGIDEIVIGSGGQEATGPQRTGSTRHDNGMAADLQLYVGGRPLDFTNPNDQALYQRFVAAAHANGATGFGAGTDYMGNNTIHVGFGDPAVWGAGGSSATAPEWLAAAYNGSAAPATAAASQPAGGYTNSAPGWTPPTDQERAALRAMILNPVTREQGMALAIQRMTPPAPVQPDPIEINGQLVDRNTGRVIGDYRNPQAAAPTWRPITDPTTGWTGRQNTATGDVEWNPAGMQPQGPAAPNEAPTDIQVYDYYVSQERAAGREPKSFNDWDLERRGRLGGIDPTATEARYGILYQNAARELPIIEQTFSALTELGNQAANALPDVIGNWLVTPEYQRALSSMTQIIQMQTYALTGAAATESEAQRIARTMLPAVGDGPGVIADKLARTRAAVESIRSAAGPAAGAAAPTASGTATPVPPGVYEYDPNTRQLVPVAP